MYLSLIMTFSAPVVGLTVLISVYGLESYGSQVLFAVFIISFILSSILVFVPVSVPKGNTRIMNILHNFFEGRKQIIKAKKTLFACALLMNINFVLSSIRLGIIYNSLGQNVHPAGFLILGASGYFVMFISLTPGAIGIRELVLGAAAVVLGVPLKIGIPAALIDRAIALSYSFVVGGGCAMYLWNRSPQDFKNLQQF